LNFLESFPKNTHISNDMKIHSVEAKLFHVNRQTDGRGMTKLRAAFHNFVNAPKMARKAMT
jgi:hypothetical protein